MAARLSIWARSLACISLLAVGPAFAHTPGAPPTFEQVQAWVTEEWNRAQEYPPVDGLQIRYSKEIPEPVPSAAELEQMRRTVAGKPAHPLRSTLAEYERIIREGPKKETYTVWSEGEGR